MNPRETYEHPRLGRAEVVAAAGNMVRLRKPNGEDIWLCKEDERQWKLVPEKDLSPIKVPHNSDR